MGKITCMGGFVKKYENILSGKDQPANLLACLSGGLRRALITSLRGTSTVEKRAKAVKSGRRAQKYYAAKFLRNTLKDCL